MPDHETSARSDGRRTALIVSVVAAAFAAAMLLGPLATSGTERPESAAGQTAGAPRQAAPSEQEVTDTLSSLARRDPADPVALGDPDAPVVMIEYSDFQCPFCGQFARETEPELIERYVEDGTLRIEWRDFPYLGPESSAAARAGRAAAAQGGFWAFHQAMYADPLPPNSGGLTTDHLAAKAAEAGLDVPQFTEDMTSGELARLVDQDFREGQGIGVNGTPAFLINGRPVIGAQPLEVFVDAIEQAAAEAS